jgi:hypothetical protein
MGISGPQQSKEPLVLSSSLQFFKAFSFLPHQIPSSGPVPQADSPHLVNYIPAVIVPQNVFERTGLVEIAESLSGNPKFLPVSSARASQALLIVDLV